MVSLSNQNTGSYFGFSDNRSAMYSTNSSDDDLIVDHIELISGPEINHRSIKTTWAIVLAKILYIALTVSAYLVPFFCGEANLKCGEDSISLTLYIHGGMWFILFGLDKYFLMKHNESRLNGYLDFYRTTQNLRRMPFMINSCANAVIVVVMKILDNHCGQDGKCTFLNKIIYIQIVVSVECAMALIFLVIYLVHTVKFNNKKALPDVTQEELMTSFVNSHSSADLGFRNENYKDQVMEKQADMIRYLRQHTETLAKKNLTLQGEINKLKGVRREGSVHGAF
ncbi:transmembrane protein 192-like [Physella acuta]|uniref:transmembrane protein 192-like n=1 Tax=Physella acuta TaxID=109671 RepID=UPI0027DE5E97|nr:transmembrane protein 192-like [Physella acuta]